MAHMEIRETLALVGDLRELARRGEAGAGGTDLTARRRLLEITDAISERLSLLDVHLGGSSAEPAPADEETESRLAALGRVTAEVGFQINNLLAVLATRMELTDICLREGDGERTRSNFRLAREYLHQVETLAVRLLDFSGKPATPLRSDLNEIVRATVSFARLLGPYENIEFETDLAGDLSPVVIDPARWQQLLLSLIANAADAVGRRKGEGGRVGIATSNVAGEETVLLAVRDEGRGIAPADLDRVFEPGFTTKGSAREGLGLTTCRRIVEEAGGAIAIEGEERKGTTVTIRIPTRR